MEQQFASKQFKLRLRPSGTRQATILPLRQTELRLEDHPGEPQLQSLTEHDVLKARVPLCAGPDVEQPGPAEHCAARCSADASYAAGSSFGSSLWLWPVPNAVGAKFYTQVFVLDEGVNTLGVIATNAGVSTIGL